MTTHRSLKNDKLDHKAFYYSTLDELMKSEYDSSSKHLAYLRSEELSKDQTAECIRRFLSTRLSLKQGDASIDSNWLNLPIQDSSWLAAEKFYVLASIHYHNQNLKDAYEAFQNATAKFFTLNMYSRSLLSSFNSMICQLELEQPSLEWQLESLRKLQQQAEQHLSDNGCYRILALIHRQRAHALEDGGRLHAALQEASKAVDLFAVHGPTSDYQLTLIHAADLCLDLHDEFKAKTFLDYVISPIDRKVEFPLAVVKWRLGEERPLSSSFKIAQKNWIEKLERLNSVSHGISKEDWVWNLTDFSLSREAMQLGTLKPSSMEGQLILQLSKKHASKALLIEVLWPEQNEVENLSNRLHRLLNRINSKYPSLIVFDGRSYRLSHNLRIKTS